MFFSLNFTHSVAESISSPSTLWAQLRASYMHIEKDWSLGWSTFVILPNKLWIFDNKWNLTKKMNFDNKLVSAGIQNISKCLNYFLQTIRQSWKSLLLMFELSRWKIIKISCLIYDLLHKLNIYHQICFLREKQWHIAIIPWDLFLILLLIECWIAASYKAFVFMQLVYYCVNWTFKNIVHNILSSQDLLLLIQLYQNKNFYSQFFLYFYPLVTALFAVATIVFSIQTQSRLEGFLLLRSN